VARVNIIILRWKVNDQLADIPKEIKRR